MEHSSTSAAVIAPTSATSALDIERRLATQTMSWLRLWACGGYLVLQLFFGELVRNPTWSGGTFPALCYFVIALLLHHLGRMQAIPLVWSRSVVPAVDTPIAAWVIWESAQDGSGDGAIGFGMGVFAILILLVASTLDQRMIAIEAFVAGLCESILQIGIGVSAGAIVYTWVMVAALGGGCAYLTHRLKFLVESLLAEQIQRERLTEEASRLERERIMRDLHDDVGAKLLQIRHKANAPEMVRLAAAALTSLQEIVHELKATSGAPLDHTLADLRAEIHERLTDANVRFTWNGSADDSVYQLSPMERSNLVRVVREIVSNSLRHGKPSEIEFNVEASSGMLSLRVTDDGGGPDPELWRSGTGLASMRLRTDALRGIITWTGSMKEGRPGIAVSLRIPVGPQRRPSPQSVNAQDSLLQGSSPPWRGPA